MDYAASKHVYESLSFKVMNKVWWSLLMCLQNFRKNVKSLAKIFIIDFMDLCVLPSFWILCKRRLKNVTNGFMFNVVLTKLKTSEPIDYSCIVNIWWNVTVKVAKKIEKKQFIFLIIELSLNFFLFSYNREV